MTKGFFYKSAAAVALSMAFTPAAVVAHAQDYTSGAITGTVVDANGAPVSGATVTATSQDRGTAVTATTGADGSFRFPRLAIGGYDMTASADGFDVSEGATDLAINQTRNVTITLVPTGSRETIVVTGVQQGLFDFDQTTTGLNVDVDELTLRTPITRNLQSVALLAPGAGLGDTAFTGGFNTGDRATQISLSGSSIGENVYYVNGMNITDFVDFIGASTVPFEFYDQLEIKNGGYSAEFGRSTGGIINAVTKSGTNEFEYGFNAYWQPDGLTEDTPDTFAALNRFDETDIIDYNIFASGPIIKDRLFFYGLYAQNINEQVDNSLSRSSHFKQDDPFYGLKLDAVIADGHNLEFTFWRNESDSKTNLYYFDGSAGTDGTGDPATTGFTEGSSPTFQTGNLVGNAAYSSGGDNYIFKYTGTFTDWLTGSLLYGETEAQIGSSSGNADQFFFVNSTAANNSIGNNVRALLREGEAKRELIRGDLDVYIDDFFGSHHIRAGFDQEKQTVEDDQFYSGPMLTIPAVDADIRGAYADPSSPTGFSVDTQGGVIDVQQNGAGDAYRYRVRSRVVDGSYETDASAIYIQDSWKPIDNLTLNLGVRQETFDNKTLSGESYAKFDDMIAPRFGIIYDPFNDGKNKLYGSWGKYFLPVAANTNIRLGGNERDLRPVWQFDPSLLTDRNGDGIINAEEALDPATGLPYNFLDPSEYIGSSVFSDGIPDDPRELVSTTLKPQYMEELVLGAERQFDNDWIVGLRYVNRELKRGLEDAAVDAGVLAWCAQEGIAGCAATWSGFHHYVLINPGSDVTYFTDDAPVSTGGEFVQIDLTSDLLPYPKVEREFESFELTFERPWDGKWSLQGSYVNSWLKGNWEGSVKSDNGQTDAGLTTDFDQPGLTDGAYGLLPQHRRHRFKMWGAYALTDTVTLGTNVRIESPRKFGCIGVHPTDFFASLYGANSWFCQGQATPRASQLESDWVNQYDFTASWAPKTEYGDVQFRVDVFNIFNQNAATDLWEYGDLNNGAIDPDYGKPVAFQTPRSVRFGISFKR